MLKQRLSLFLRAMPLLVLSASAVAAGEARASEQDKVHARSIKNTRHNLSRSGRKVGNTVVADGTSRICIFCHTPHQSKPTAPLWNRESAGVTYKLYGSSTLRGVPQQPKGMSRLCLSCHDGTVAIGAVRRRPRGEPNEKAFSSGGALKRLAGMPTSLGTDLSDDHPIMVDYDEAARYNDEIVPRGFVSRAIR